MWMENHCLVTIEHSIKMTRRKVNYGFWLGAVKMSYFENCFTFTNWYERRDKNNNDLFEVCAGAEFCDRALISKSFQTHIIIQTRGCAVLYKIGKKMHPHAQTLCARRASSHSLTRRQRLL
jgi:hypothetical protein